MRCEIVISVNLFSQSSPETRRVNMKVSLIFFAVALSTISNSKNNSDYDKRGSKFTRHSFTTRLAVNWDKNFWTIWLKLHNIDSITLLTAWKQWISYLHIFIFLYLSCICILYIHIHVQSSRAKLAAHDLIFWLAIIP